LNIPIFRKR